MSYTPTAPTLAQSFDPVKFPVNFRSPSDKNSMIHHNQDLPRSKIIVSYKSIGNSSRYGVSRSYRILSPQLLFKKFDHVRDALKYVLGMPPAQREVTLRLLRLWAYYGYVYPKEATITAEPGCSKATFWRTIRLLEELGLVQVVSRYVIRPHAQISNLYRLDKLVVLLARYLAEHGVGFREKWLKPYLTMLGSHFWTLAFAAARETDFEGRCILPILTPPAFSK